jgi:hypothetical protein
MVVILDNVLDEAQTVRDSQAQLGSVALAQAVVHKEIAYATNLHRLFPLGRKKSYHRL